MNFEFRKMTQEDVPAVIDVHRQSVYGLCAEHYTEQQMEVWTGLFRQKMSEDGMKNRDNIGIVALQDGRIVGYGFLNTADKEVKGVYLLPEVAGRGLGREIVSRLESFAREHHLNGLTLGATTNAVPFYESCGFSRVKDEIFELAADCRLPCVRMEKKL